MIIFTVCYNGLSNNDFKGLSHEKERFLARSDTAGFQLWAEKHD
jgi:hypothetical protein